MAQSRNRVVTLYFVVVVCAVHCLFSFHAFVMSQSIVHSCQNMTGVVDCSNGGLLVSDIVSYPIDITCSVCRQKSKCCQHNGAVGLKLAHCNMSGHHELVLGIFMAVLQSCSDMNSTESLKTRNVIGFNGSNNDLVDVPWFSQWPYLKWIDLSNNNITKLSISLNFGNKSALETLILRNNEIHVTHPGVFDQLHNLKYLYLSDNPNIEDWSFFISSDLTLVEYSGHNKLNGSDSNLFKKCSSNTTVIVDEDSIISHNLSGNRSHKCIFTSVWPAKAPKVSPIELCKDEEGLQSSTKTTTVEGTNTASQNVISNIPNKLCSNFNILSLDFLSTGLNCIWVSVVITAATILTVVTVLLLVRWQLKRRHEGRYSRWLAVYNQRKSSVSEEHEFDIKHVHCNEESNKTLETISFKFQD